MPSSVIYLDESGDLGFNFKGPYRVAGSSRYLTIAAICAPAEKSHLPGRAVKKLGQKVKWPAMEEMKWGEMNAAQRLQFAAAAKRQCELHEDIHLHAIVVKKENVQLHIQADPNKLYNYMIRLALLDRMANYDVVTLIPDPRSIKVKSGNSLHDYLQTELWFTKKSGTKLITTPIDSANCKGIQFADMVAGAVQARYEDNNAAAYQQISPHVQLTPLFF